MIGLPVGEKPEERVCKRCGSDNVTAQIEATWNPRWNTWDPTGEVAAYYCHAEKCGGLETKIEARPQAS